MLKGEEQLRLATLRIELRGLDADIAAIRQESRRYRQMRFGLDIKDIQLTALLDQRGACAERVEELSSRLRPRRHANPLAWLLLPLSLWLLLQKALASKAPQEVAPAEPALPFRREDAEPLIRERVLAGTRN